MKNWIYNNEEIDSIKHPLIPKGAIGFVYIIKTYENKFYIGKKNFYSRRKRRFGKKEIAKIKDKRKKHWEYVTKESNWKEYVGSNKELQKDIKKGIKYEKYILTFAFSKMQLTYLETKQLFIKEVLESDKWYNSNISGKFYKKHTIKE